MDKVDLYELESRLCRVLTHPVRLHILDVLRAGEKSPADIAVAVGTSKANLSAHLSILREAGVVAVRRAGQRQYYRVLYPEIYRAFDIVRDILADVLAKHGRLAQEVKKPKRP